MRIINHTIRVYIYICVCVCMCVCVYLQVAGHSVTILCKSLTFVFQGALSGLSSPGGCGALFLAFCEFTSILC